MLLGACSLWYCKKVFADASEACYVLPCYEGPGLQALWKVNKGVTFTGESSGVFASMHAGLGYLLFRNNSESIRQSAHFLLGIFTGMTACAALLSLNMVWVWGAEWNLLGDLTLLNEDNVVFEESGRHMAVNQPLISTFRQLFYLSAAMLLLQGWILLQLLASKAECFRHFHLLGGGQSNVAGELTPLQMGQQSARTGEQPYRDSLVV